MKYLLYIPLTPIIMLNGTAEIDCMPRKHIGKQLVIELSVILTKVLLFFCLFNRIIDYIGLKTMFLLIMCPSDQQL